MGFYQVYEVERVGVKSSYLGFIGVTLRFLLLRIVVVIMVAKKFFGPCVLIF